MSKFHSAYLYIKFFFFSAFLWAFWEQMKHSFVVNSSEKSALSIYLCKTEHSVCGQKHFNAVKNKTKPKIALKKGLLWINELASNWSRHQYIAISI